MAIGPRGRADYPGVPCDTTLNMRAAVFIPLMVPQQQHGRRPRR